ncbi:MAG: serine/threonine-protein kinase, partial [Planctomycetota bacterium]
MVEDQPTVISTRPPLPSAGTPPLALGQRPEDVAPGTTLGDFELIEFIGGGGMGRVYRARDTRLGRTVALKVLSRDQPDDTEAALRFRNEARSAARLNHDGIAQVYSAGEDTGVSFIAFEFVDGINVRDLIVERGALPLAEALSYTLQVATALAHAAARNVVHRDIKPSNVLITFDGRVKLIDMGLARLQKTGSSIQDLTASGVTLGTFDYISPEQACDPRNADERSDIYSLGCTLFYMLTGRPPFPEGNPLQKLLQHHGLEPPDVREYRPELPDDVARVLRKMMAKEPRRRYQDSAKLTTALVSLAEQIGLAPVGAGPAVWAAAREPEVSFLKRHGIWLAPVVTLLVIITLLHSFWASLSPEAGRLTPSWVETLNEPIPDLPMTEQSPGIPGGMRENPKSLPDPAGGAERGDTTDESGRPKPKEGGNAKPEPGATDANATAAAQGSVDVTHVNPFRRRLTISSRNTGLGVDRFQAALASCEPVSAVVRPDFSADFRAARLGQTGGARNGSEAGQPAVEPRRDGRGTLIVDPSGQASDAYPTLEAAFGAAFEGDVIELRHNGRLATGPLAAPPFELILRAAAGCRPIVAFRPSPSEAIAYPRSMLTLAGSQLTLSNVGLEFDLSEATSSGDWSLFKVGTGDAVVLERCWLTIRNASDEGTSHHPDVAFFRVRNAPEVDPTVGNRPIARVTVTLS